MATLDRFARNLGATQVLRRPERLAGIVFGLPSAEEADRLARWLGDHGLRFRGARQTGPTFAVRYAL